MPHPRMIYFAVLAVAASIAMASLSASGEQYAFLVGIDAYGSSSGLNPLRYSEKDVDSLAALLLKSGYRKENVRVLTQSRAMSNFDLAPTSKNIDAGLSLLLEDLQPRDSVLMALAGHGVQFHDDPEGYFCPIDARLDSRSNLLAFSAIYQRLKRSPATTKILLADACRNDPFERSARSASSVTAPAPPVPEGSVIAFFSCSEGQRAWEDEELGHGVFFHFILEGLQGAADRKTGVAGEISDGDGIVELMELVAFTQTRVKDFVSHKRQTRQMPALRTDTSNLATIAQLPILSVSRSLALDPWKTNDLQMRLALIPAGEFLMGSHESAEALARAYSASASAFGDEYPQHRVRIAEPFYLGVHEVTVGQFRQFVTASKHKTTSEESGTGGFGWNQATGKIEGPSPKYNWSHVGWPQTDNHPVVNVSWHDAQAFVQWLSKREGATYRLPTEAEWEYACRANSATRYCNGDTPEAVVGVGNIADESLSERFGGIKRTFANDGHVFTAPAGSFRANAWGLYDMHGNVWEWCQDAYAPDFYARSPQANPQGPPSSPLSNRVMRGGSWYLSAAYARSAVRDSSEPTRLGTNIGFRIARTIAN